MYLGLSFVILNALGFIIIVFVSFVFFLDFIWVGSNNTGTLG